MYWGSGQGELRFEKESDLTLIDESNKTDLFAHINLIVTFKGTTNALCMDDILYDVI